MAVHLFNEFITHDTSLDPLDPMLWVLLGQAQYELSMCREAMESFRKSISMKETHVAFGGLGLAARAENDNVTAACAFRRALELEPGKPHIHVLLASSLRAIGDCSAAESTLEQGLQIDSNHKEILFNLALLCGDRAPDRSLALLRRLIELDPNHAQAYREVGFLFLCAKDLIQAREALHRSLELDATDAWAHLYLGAISIDLANDLEVGEEHYRQACALAGEHAFARLVLAEFYRSTGRYDESETLLRDALQMDSNNIATLFMIGRLLINTGRVQEATGYLLRAKAMDVHNKYHDEIQRLLARN